MKLYQVVDRSKGPKLIEEEYEMVAKEFNGIKLISLRRIYKNQSVDYWPNYISSMSGYESVGTTPEEAWEKWKKNTEEGLKRTESRVRNGNKLMVKLGRYLKGYEKRCQDK